MKYLCLIFLLALTPLTIFAQSTGSIRGTIKTSDGNPAAFVNVSIDGTSKGAVADDNGKYEIRNVTPGNYKLVASFVGLENQQQNVDVSAGQVSIIDFVLSENTLQLEEVTISC